MYILEEYYEIKCSDVLLKLLIIKININRLHYVSIWKSILTDHIFPFMKILFLSNKINDRLMRLFVSHS